MACALALRLTDEGAEGVVRVVVRLDFREQGGVNKPEATFTSWIRRLPDLVENQEIEGDLSRAGIVTS
jgi:hypothetical protein